MSTESIRQVDPQAYEMLKKEEARQQSTMRLIASENYTSSAVLAAVGSVFSNKYSEGYPKRRYYQGQENTDAIEILAIQRARKLFGAEHANVQPYSGSPANLAVYLGLCKPGDAIVGLGLPHGGHLSHGYKVSFTGQLFDAHQYGVNPETELIDLDEVRALCKKVSPKILSVGTTAYSRIIDWEGFAKIAKEVGAILVADVAHIAGLIAGGAYPSPVPFADVVTTTTHKTLRGPRGGMILCRQQYKADINRAVFPGMQGGPHMNQVAGLAIALKEATGDAFKDYAHQVVKNAKVLADELKSSGLRLVTDGTDSHLILVDLTPKNVGGRAAAIALENAGIVCNSNTIPFDKRSAFDPSGIRVGTPSITTRGLKEAHMKQVADWMLQVIDAVDDEAVQARVKGEVAEFMKAFPAPGVPVE